MKQSYYRRLEELEDIRATAEQAKAARAAERSGQDFLREIEAVCGHQKLPGESLADAFARWLGITTLELKDQLDVRCRAIEEADVPRRPVRRRGGGFSR